MPKGDKELRPVKKHKNGIVIYSNGMMRGPVARIAFVNLTRPKTNESEDGTTRESYGFAYLMPKGTDITLMKEACRKFAIQEKGADKGKRYKLPFRDQGEKVDDYDGFVEGAQYFNTSSKYKPRCTGRNREEVELSTFYSGCYVQALFRPYVYDRLGNKGVALGLSGVQFVRDGEPLSGGGVDPADWADDHEGGDIDDEDDVKPRKSGKNRRRQDEDEDEEDLVG